VTNRLYLSPPHVMGDERELLLDAFDSNWIAPLGPHVDEFEREMCQSTGAAHAAALSSGTAALHLALVLAGVSPGDEVLCSTFTFSASANAVKYCGGTPVFVDSETTTWNLDPDLLEEALSEGVRREKLPRAVIAVDLYGQCCQFERIEDICANFGVTLIEDAAEALGASYRGKMAGTFGRMAVLSFNGNKIITTSGGGMLVSDDRTLIERARYLATQAREPFVHYEHTTVGYNYRLSNLLAAVGRGQLKTLTHRVARRREIFARYEEGLQELPGFGFMPEHPDGRSNRWLTCITVDPDLAKTNPEAIRHALEVENIEARPLWKPMHQQPVFTGCRIYGGEVSSRLFATGLCLPSGSQMTDDQQDRVISIIRGAALGHSEV
jgi:dTDP-4-amino-4,6-dideoxygalactose transaminase